jgi:hypothetical protein
VRELGIGGQGVVYEAVRESDGLVVAAKILRTDVRSATDLIDRFEREAQAAQRLHHEHIVAVHGMVEWQGFRIILQELVTGGSLDDAIKDRHGQRDRTDSGDCRWAADMCRPPGPGPAARPREPRRPPRHQAGQRAAHPGGASPRSPTSAWPRSRTCSVLTQTGDRMGTPNYMSPEQVEAAHGGVDSRTDIYSLSAVLYRMVSRRVPFQADNLSTLFRDILTRAPTPPRKHEPGVPRDLEAVCLKGLQKAPGARYATAKEFAADLQRFLEGKATVARPEGAIERGARSLSHLALSTLAVVALLVPTVWLLVDFVLQRAAESDPGVHSVRLGVVGLAALVLAWPLSLLGLRLSRGQRWTVGVAWLAALGLGALGGWRIVEQRRDQVHLKERDELAHTIDFEGLGDRRDVDDLLAFAARWESGSRPTTSCCSAEATSSGCAQRRPRTGPGASRRRGLRAPTARRSLLAVADALGDDDRTAQAAARLWHDPTSRRRLAPSGTAQATCSPTCTATRTRGRPYDIAARRPDADQFRDELNLKMAQVSAGLCQYDDADSSSTTTSNGIAKTRGPTRSASPSRLRRTKRSAPRNTSTRSRPAEATRGRPTSTTDTGSSAGRPSRRRTSWTRSCGTSSRTSRLLDWCAVQALLDGERLDVAEAIWRRMSELKPESAVPYIGLSNVHNRRGESKESADAARRAIELDPLFYQSYYNLAWPCSSASLRRRATRRASRWPTSRRSWNRSRPRCTTDGPPARRAEQRGLRHRAHGAEGPPVRPRSAKPIRWFAGRSDSSSEGPRATASCRRRSSACSPSATTPCAPSRRSRGTPTPHWGPRDRRWSCCRPRTGRNSKSRSADTSSASRLRPPPRAERAAAGRSPPPVR